MNGVRWAILTTIAVEIVLVNLLLYNFQSYRGFVIGIVCSIVNHDLQNYWKDAKPDQQEGSQK